MKMAALPTADTVSSAARHSGAQVAWESSAALELNAFSSIRYQT